MNTQGNVSQSLMYVVRNIHALCHHLPGHRCPLQAAVDALNMMRMACFGEGGIVIPTSLHYFSLPFFSVTGVVQRQFPQVSRFRVIVMFFVSKEMRHMRAFTPVLCAVAPIFYADLAAAHYRSVFSSEVMGSTSRSGRNGVPAFPELHPKIMPSMYYC